MAQLKKISNSFISLFASIPKTSSWASKSSPRDSIPPPFMIKGTKAARAIVKLMMNARAANFFLSDLTDITYPIPNI